MELSTLRESVEISVVSRKVAKNWIFSESMSLLRLLKHADERDLGFGADFLGELDLWGEVFEAGVKFFEGVHFHVAAVCAGAVVCGARDEVFLGDFFLNAVEHS